MKEKYLNALPAGYRLKEEITPHKGAYALACAAVGVAVLMLLFFVADFFEGFDALLSPLVFVLYFAPGAALYMFVYAGACGLTFKLLTKGPVEYFVNTKYCLASMPQSFIDLKTRVLAGVFPAAVFTPILAGALVLYGPSTLPYLFIASAASCHAIILMIELRVLLKLRKYKGQGALINSARDCTAVFVNDGIDGEPDQTTEGYLEWLGSDEMRIGDRNLKRTVILNAGSSLGDLNVDSSGDSNSLYGNGVLTGYTTDGIGYMRSLKEAGHNIIGKKMTLLGVGGAATSILVQAALDGVSEISVFNRKSPSFERTKELIEALKEYSSCKIQLFDLADEERLRHEIANSAILVNATSIGMAPHTECSVITDSSLFHKDLIVSDVIYNPRETKFLQLAKKAGCETLNGLGMLLYQGAEAFKLWTGQDMPVELIKEKYFSNK